MHTIPKRIQIILLLFTLAVVCGCCLHISATLALSDHELIPDFWHFDHWTWPDESNGMLSSLLYQTLWAPMAKVRASEGLFVRFPFIVLALVCLILTYKLGNNLAQRCATRHPWGLYGTFLLGNSALFLALSSHKRFYALNMVFVVAATLILVETCHKRSWRWLVLYQLAMLGCCTTMLLSTIIIVPHLVFYVATCQTRRSKAFIQATILLLINVGILGILCVADSHGFERFSYMPTSETFSLFFHNGDMGEGYYHPVFSRYLKDGDIRDMSESRLLCLACMTSLALLFLGHDLWKNGRNRSQILRWLCPMISLWGLLALESFSWAVKNVSIAPNYSWLYPFWGLTLAQAISTNRWIRYVMLAAIIAAIPYSHLSFVANRAGFADTVRPLSYFRHISDTVVVSFPDFQLAQVAKQLAPYNEDKTHSDISSLPSILDDPTIIQRVQPQLLGDAMQYIEINHRSHPCRLWVICDHDNIRKMQRWLSDRADAGLLQYNLQPPTYQNSNIYMITLHPHTGQNSVIMRPAPTPLRGHSALKFLQQCK